MSEKKLLNMSKYAEHRGVKDPGVRYAIRMGKIPKEAITRTKEGHILIDVALADASWDTRADNRRTTDWGKILEEQPTPGQVAEGVPESRVSKARKEAAEAELAELKLAKEKGLLLEAEEVRRSAFKAARMTRDAMMNIPDRVAAEFAAETDVFKITQRLRLEIRKALEGLRREDESDSESKI